MGGRGAAIAISCCCCCWVLLLPSLLRPPLVLHICPPSAYVHTHHSLRLFVLALVFAHPHLLLPLVACAVVCLFMLVPATWLCLFGLCSCLSMLIWAHLGFVCAHSLVRAHSVVHV